MLTFSPETVNSKLVRITAAVRGYINLLSIKLGS